MAIPFSRLDLVRLTVREAARAAFSAVRAANPEDRFYAFVLWTTAVIHRPVPCVFSEQGLARVMVEYGETDPANLRWSEADSPYDCFGDEYFSDVERLFKEFGNPYDLSDKDHDALLSAIVGAMRDLDREEFFGSGATREGVVINVTMPGDEDEEHSIARARTLNPALALRTMLHDLRSSQ